MENLPAYLSMTLVLTTLLTVFAFFKAANRSYVFLFICLGWMMVQTAISITGFYTISYTLPPRFLLMVAPPLVVTTTLFLTPAGKRFLNTIDLKALTLLHVIRIPVELTLFGLFVNKTIPELMTFEGRNLDILSGISAPLVFYFAFSKTGTHKTLLLCWNILCLGLLLNIVGHAILSAPSVFQKLAFDQPNVAIMYFPFVWLPSVIVPLVFFAHLASIRQLVIAKPKPFANSTVPSSLSVGE